MKIIKHGINRTVLLIFGYALKFPCCRYEHVHFLNGCLTNWRERVITKQNDGYEFINKINPTIWCSWFGLVAIQKRIEIKVTELTDEEWLQMKCFNERKKENYGYLNGKLVCVDYG